MRETIRQALKYVLTGGMTTVINYVIFFGLMGWEMNYLAANTLAWAGAVIFAFVANRNLVFQSTGNLIREICAFVSLRLLTVLIENMLLFMMVVLCFGMSTVAYGAEVQVDGQTLQTQNEPILSARLGPVHYMIQKSSIFSAPRDTSAQEGFAPSNLRISALVASKSMEFTRAMTSSSVRVPPSSSSLRPAACIRLEVDS